MSDESAPAPESQSPSSTPATTAPASAPRVRRISTPRPKKVAKPAPAAEPLEEASAAAPSSSKKANPPAEAVESVVKAILKISPVSEAASPEPAAPHGDAEWPEPEAASSGGSSSQSDSAKRKRRRRKGKGQGQGQGGSAPTGNAGHPPEEALAGLPAEAKSQEFPQEPRPRPQAQASQPFPQTQQAPAAQHGAHPARPKVDPELLTKMAWKIYLAEVSEEGVALIGDNDAKDLSRRCFRLAEIFIEEQMRRR